MKKLVAIAVAGIAAIAILVYFDRSPGTTVAPMSAEPALAAASKAAQRPTTPTDDAATRPANAAIRAPSTPPPSIVPELPAPRRAATREKNKKLQAACDELFRRQRERQQRAFDAEPKDPAWAYAMEQKLREFTSHRFLAAQIEVSEIDCKTTFCEISARSLAPERADEFNKAIDALRKEPWNEFTGGSVTNSDDSGKSVQFARLTRKDSEVRPTPEELKMQGACFAAVNEEGDRERAARAAEPRDTGWADPTEQLLRQYLMEHTAKHPADRLEITCKTSFCELIATGRTEEFALAFQKAAQEVASEPWSDLRNGEAGGGTLSDLSGMQMYQILYRKE